MLLVQEWKELEEYDLRRSKRDESLSYIRARARSDPDRAVLDRYLGTDPDGRFATTDMVWAWRPVPTDQSIHFFGYLTFVRTYFVRGDTKGVQVLRREKRETLTLSRDVPKPITFHSQPLCTYYSDIPCDEDLLRFLKFRHRRHVLIGRRYVSIFEKSGDTNQAILDLWDWEVSHPYRMSRFRKKYSERESRKRYASSALRGIGLKWPYRIANKRREWPHILRDLGIVVEIIDREGWSVRGDYLCCRNYLSP